MLGRKERRKFMKEMSINKNSLNNSFVLSRQIHHLNIEEQEKSRSEQYDKRRQEMIDFRINHCGMDAISATEEVNSLLEYDIQRKANRYDELNKRKKRKK